MGFAFLPEKPAHIPPPRGAFSLHPLAQLVLDFVFFVLPPLNVSLISHPLYMYYEGSESKTIFSFSEFPFTSGTAVPISFLIKKHPTVFFNRFPLWLVLVFEMDMTLRDF